MRNRFCWLLLPLLLMSCGPETQPPGSNKTRPDEQVYVGLATYGDLVDNPTKAADGSVIAPPLYTAAHRTLPLGTKILVTNLQNNASLAVTITHHGPEKQEFLLELNLNAAKELGMLSGSPVQVRFEVTQ